MASGRKRNAVDAYIDGTSHGPFRPDNKAARVVTESEMQSAYVSKPASTSSTTETCFSPIYYEAAIPPPTLESVGWCFWCGGRVILPPSVAFPAEGDTFDCTCVCTACGMDRVQCRQGSCSGFFVAQEELRLFRLSGRDLLKFRGIVREKLLQSYGEKIKDIFWVFHLWRKRFPPPSLRGSADSEAAGQKSPCPICHILYTPRSGFAGLCGACRVYRPLNPYLIREGVRGGDAEAKARQPPAPTESGATKARRK